MAKFEEFRERYAKTPFDRIFDVLELRDILRVYEVPFSEPERVIHGGKLLKTLNQGDYQIFDLQTLDTDGPYQDCSRVTFTDDTGVIYRVYRSLDDELSVVMAMHGSKMVSAEHIALSKQPTISHLNHGMPFVMSALRPISNRETTNADIDDYMVLADNVYLPGQEEYFLTGCVYALEVIRESRGKKYIADSTQSTHRFCECCRPFKYDKGKAPE